MKIVALDMGKSKSIYCEYETTTGGHRFGKVATEPQAIRAYLSGQNGCRIVLEIGPWAGWVYDIICLLGLEVQIANPSHEAWRWKSVKTKTDRQDALKLAKLSAMGQLPQVYMPKPQVRQKRALIAYRRKLIGRITQVKNSIRMILEREGIRLAEGKKGWTCESFKRLEQMACRLEETDADTLWRGQLWEELETYKHLETSLSQVTDKLDTMAKEDLRIQRLTTIPGVGRRLAEAIVAYIDNPHRFSTAKQVGSYVGLTPRQFQSGQMDRQGSISGQGNALLRSLLVEVSWVGLQYNPWLRQTYQSLLRGSPSRKKIAITGVARKLLIRCWAMLRDESVWRNDSEDREAA